MQGHCTPGVPGALRATHGHGPTFKLAVCHLWPGEKLPRGDIRWKQHTRSFVAESHTIASLAEAMTGNGYAIAAVVRDDYRTAANFVSAQHCGLDFDQGTCESSLDGVLVNAFIADHAAFVYETPSSTAAAPRCRVIFILDQPFTDADEYRLANEALLWRFNQADPACKDAARFYYGRCNAQHRVLGNILYRDVLQEEIVEPYLAACALEQQQATEQGAAPDPWAEGPRRLGRKALDFVANGAPLLEQRTRALSAGRNYLAAGSSLEDTAAALMRGFSASPQRPDDPWTLDDALAIARDLAKRPPPPRAPRPAPDPRLSFAEMRALLGQDLPPADPTSTPDSAGWNSASQLAQALSLIPNVQDTVRENGDQFPYRIPDKVGHGRFTDQALRREAKERFPVPTATRPWTKGMGLYSEAAGKGVVVNMLSNSWLNPYNAQVKRQRMYFNLNQRLSEKEVYQRQEPVDDWSATRQETLSRGIRRQEGHLLWVDNGLSHGYRLYLTDVPGLEGFNVVDNLANTLARALEGIRPPGRGEHPNERFRPFGGTRGWTHNIEATWEEDKDRWQVIAVAKKQIDFHMVESDCIVEDLPTTMVPNYWLNQVGKGLEIDFSKYGEAGFEEAVKFCIAQGMVPTRAAMTRMPLPAGEMAA